MEIIIDKQTNIVKYTDKVLSEKGVFWANKRDLTTNQSNAFSTEVDDTPADFRGGHYTWTEADGFVATPLRAQAIIEAKEKAIEDQETAIEARKAGRIKLKDYCIQAISDLIQAEVDKYNLENDLALKDVYRCQQYAQTPTYTHQAFCQAVWDWNVEVWEEARSLFTKAKSEEITVTSPQDIIDLLPVFTY